MTLLFLIINIGCGKKALSDEKLNLIQSSIEHGTKSKAHQFLNVVKLKIKSNHADKNKRNSICSATIIHPYIALTSAHCLPNNMIDLYIKYENKTSPNKLYIHKIIMHEKYKIKGENDLSKDHDLAILILKKPFPLESNKIIRPISSGTDIHNKPAVIVGYGLDENNKNGNIKKFREIELYEDSFCQNYESHLNVEYSANHGDSGGPIFVQLDSGEIKQVGVTSYGKKGEFFNIFCRFTSVIDLRKYEDWIYDKTGLNELTTSEEVTEYLKKSYLLK